MYLMILADPPTTILRIQSITTQHINTAAKIHDQNPPIIGDTDRYRIVNIVHSTNILPKNRINSIGIFHKNIKNLIINLFILVKIVILFNIYKKTI